MKKVLSYIASTIFILAFFYGCTVDNTSSVDPVEPAKKIVKSESKWLLDPVSEIRIQKVHYKEFDKLGFLYKFEEYDDKGILDVENTYTYSNNISYEEKKYFSVSGGVDSVQKNYYVYNPSGKISRKIVCDKAGDTLTILSYDYDTKGNLVKKVEYSLREDKTTETKYSYSYNESGNLIERIINPGNNGTYDLKDEYFYPAPGNNFEKRSYDSEGKIKIIYTYTYNNEGRIIKETQSSIDNKVLFKYSFDYTYY